MSRFVLHLHEPSPRAAADAVAASQLPATVRAVLASAVSELSADGSVVVSCEGDLGSSSGSWLRVDVRSSAPLAEAPRRS